MSLWGAAHAFPVMLDMGGQALGEDDTDDPDRGLSLAELKRLMQVNLEGFWPRSCHSGDRSLEAGQTTSAPFLSFGPPFRPTL